MSRGWYGILKRSIDVVGAAAGLILVSPLLLAISAAIILDSPGPVCYRGTRVGRNGKLFSMLKFRSMVIDADQHGASSTPEDDPRLTRVGARLRRHKLDEIPQLVNVLRGDMSLVGPRPQVPWAVAMYTEDERRVLTVRPGMTDYASLAFINEGEILRGSRDPDREYFEKIHPHKMRLSLKYVDEQSLRTDARILAATFARILPGASRRRDGRQEG
jgi:lipopolysaccharide/colanic/teichoic acid biosynthesis glycosyltransferase